MQQLPKGCIRWAGRVGVLGVTDPGKGERSYTLKIHDEQNINFLSKDRINYSATPRQVGARGKRKSQNLILRQVLSHLILQ